jgi:predicted nucleic acid-binding protein
MANSEVFLDTNALIALLNRADQLHQSAAAAWEALLRNRRPVVVTDWIFAETGNGMAKTNGRQETARFLKGLASSSLCEVVFVTDGLLDEALSRFHDRTDKSWGLVDCASMVVMERRGIRDAFTNDHHFEQAGFTCLLPDSSG